MHLSDSMQREGKESSTTRYSSMKEEAARAVLCEAWLRGQRCVELHRDGKRTIFVCMRCGRRCYSDAALVDHLKGNVHARLSVALTSDKTVRNDASEYRDGGEERAIVARGSEEERPGPSRTSLEWMTSGELFFSVRSTGAASVVDSSWFVWKEKGNAPGLGWQVGEGRIAYAVVKFPYSDTIGRGGDWKLWSELKQARSSGMQAAEERMLLALSSAATETSSLKVTTGLSQSHQARAFLKHNSPPSMETMIDQNVSQLELEKQKHGKGNGASSRLLQRVCKRKKAKVVERLCFICHQRMSSGKDVAALLNLQTQQIVCSSRNKLGAFHVFHSSCLMDWISICELKTFTGQVDHRIDHTSEGAIFCPECQGTGLNVRGAQVEHPRYNLAQVFDWILELIQARKAWRENAKKRDTSSCGLLFRDNLEGTVQSRGFVHYYSGCGDDLLTGNTVA